MMVEELFGSVWTNASGDASPMARRQRLFLINISVGAVQDNRCNRESQEYQRQRTLMTGNLLSLMPAQHLRFVSAMWLHEQKDPRQDVAHLWRMTKLSRY
jgi:hypothetical protein